jgi:hypothetical protein
MVAVRTKTGFLPHKPDKRNQDSYFIIRDFSNIKYNWFFGVCDGHGMFNFLIDFRWMWTLCFIICEDFSSLKCRGIGFNEESR